MNKISDSTTSKSERNFNEFMQRGDDFFKIELLRQAKSWYEKALIIKPDNEKVQSCISDCKMKLSFENRVVKILISIASMLILLYYLFLNK
jgi:hypothetical protein